MTPWKTSAGAARGALVSVVATYPVAALFALVYRFPVPFGGYVSGPQGALLSAIGVTFYGALFGGFAVQAALGAVAGAMWSRAPAAGGGASRRWLLPGLAASVPGVALLSVLDKIIGPW